MTTEQAIDHFSMQLKVGMLELENGVPVELSLSEPLTQSDLDAIGSLPMLRRLSLGLTGATPDDLRRIGTLNELRSIWLFLCDIDELDWLKQFPNLRVLDLTQAATLTDDDMVHLQDVPHLEKLIIGPGVNCPGHGFAVLSKLPKLRLLDVQIPARVPVTTNPQWLRHVASCKSLETLTLHNIMFSDEIAKDMSALPSLKTLILWNGDVPAAAARELARLPNLEEFRFYTSDADVIKALAGFPALKQCRIFAPLVHADDLRELASHESLSRVMINAKVEGDESGAQHAFIRAGKTLTVDPPLPE
jgi:hypothetical protein